MNNHSDLNLDDVIEKEKRELNTSLVISSIFYIVIAYMLYQLFFGESSIGVLQSALDREEKSTIEYNKIQQENQKLQKKHFELIQLTPQEDQF